MYTKLISVETKAQFELIQQSESPFPRSSIIIIEDTQQIWTHGVFINGVTPTEVSADVTLNIAGTDYRVALADYYHKKAQDVDLGLHSYTEGILTYQKSYSVVASTHILLYYSEKGGIYSGVHIGNATDKVVFDSSSPLSRVYADGALIKNIPILDGTNVSFSTENNTITYDFASLYSGTIYYAQHDRYDVTPANNASTKATRLGGNSTEGWIVMNTGTAGASNNYYQLKITNQSSPEFFIKGSSYNTFTKVITINDVFTGGTAQAVGTKGIVPAPPADPTLYLKSDGSWSSVLPSTNSTDVYLHRNLQGNLEWKSLDDVLNSDTYSALLSSISLTTEWTNVDSLSTRLANKDGSYMVQITYAACVYTGVFSYVSTDTIEEEILLHCSGSIDSVGGTSRGRLYAKIGASSGSVYLKLAATQSESNANLSIKYKKLL